MAEQAKDELGSTGEGEIKKPRRKTRRRPKSVENLSRNSTPPMDASSSEIEMPVPRERVITAEVEPAPKKRARKKRVAKKAPPKKRVDNKLQRELTGLALFALTVLVGLSLLSYDAGDPGFGVSDTGREVQNWIGVVGAYVADGMTLSMGLVAFLVPFVLALFALNLFRPVRVRLANRAAFGGLLLVLGLVILLDVFVGRGPLAYPAGGLLGAVLGGHLARWLAPVGTAVLATFFSLFGVMLIRRRALGDQVQDARAFVSKIFALGFDSALVWREKKRLLKDERERLDAELEAERQAQEAADEQAKAERKDKVQKKARKKAKAAIEDDAKSQAPEIKIQAREEPAWAEGVEKPEINLNDTIEEPVVDGKTLRLSDTPAPVKMLPAKTEEKVEPVPAELKALKIVESEDDDKAAQIAQAEKEADAETKKAPEAFVLPPLKLLDYDAPERRTVDPAELQEMAEKLVRKFNDFGIDGTVREVRPGPVCTTYEFVPAPGIKVSRIAALADDIAMAMEAMTVRIVAPIPGKGAVGIEIPNERREMVFLKEIVADKKFMKAKSKLEMALGKDIEGKPVTANLAGMPHVLISGTTGSGKSVSVNGMICSMLYRARPDEVKFLMIDPKMLELSIYEGIPHLLLPPITDSKKAANALRWAVDEMERRYQWMSDMGVRDIEGYNERVRSATDGVDKEGRKLPKKEGGDPYETVPYVVVVVDEYADLLAVAGKEVEGYVMRLAQKARAAGIHVMLATQRPSVDVITGVIKANFPVRMGFRLASVHDSKTIVNRPGAEKLLGKGDMLMMPAGTSNLTRVHGAFISEKELHRVVEYLKTQGTPEYDMSILANPAAEDGGDFGDDDRDAKWDDAIAVVARARRCSTSWLQRQLGIGYNRAAKIVEMMEREGLIGPQQNAKGDREIHLPPVE